MSNCVTAQLLASSLRSNLPSKVTEFQNFMHSEMRSMEQKSKDGSKTVERKILSVGSPVSESMNEDFLVQVRGKFLYFLIGSKVQKVMLGMKGFLVLVDGSDDEAWVEPAKKALKPKAAPEDRFVSPLYVMGRRELAYFGEVPTVHAKWSFADGKSLYLVEAGTSAVVEETPVPAGGESPMELQVDQIRAKIETDTSRPGARAATWLATVFGGAIDSPSLISEVFGRARVSPFVTRKDLEREEVLAALSQSLHDTLTDLATGAPFHFYNVEASEKKPVANGVVVHFFRDRWLYSPSPVTRKDGSLVDPESVRESKAKTEKAKAGRRVAVSVEFDVSDSENGTETAVEAAAEAAAAAVNQVLNKKKKKRALETEAKENKETEHTEAKETTTAERKTKAKAKRATNAKAMELEAAAQDHEAAAQELVAAAKDHEAAAQEVTGAPKKRSKGTGKGTGKAAEKATGEATGAADGKEAGKATGETKKRNKKAAAPASAETRADESEAKSATKRSRDAPRDDDDF